nr:polysaccharide deacetylase family protein [Cytobacillus purgationiresistens]
MNKKVISITFDDGPDPIYTPEILDLLAQYNAKATFFVSGNKAEEHPDILKRIAKEGHEIGNHTYNHIYNASISEKTLSAELDSTNNLIEKVTGYRPVLYRPVGGLYNDSIINTAVKKDYLVIMWSWHQDPMDWSNPGSKKIVNHVISNVRPGDIVLLHDSGGDRTQTISALKSILEHLKKHQYTVVTVSDLIVHSEDIPSILFDF